jgi:two-component system CheB/CheR fusion protein
MDRILEIVRCATDYDFHEYKRETVLRIIQQRAQLRSAESLNEYAALLARDALEPALLARDMLIGVTRFFRDREAFGFLAQKVIPCIPAAKNAGESIRIWVPGCSTGEEAYSLAMLVREWLGDDEPARPVRIFATDIDATAIARARRGYYSANIAGHVSPERLSRFFECMHSSYRVGPAVREMCIFAEQSLIHDPPFRSLDLISCRNVLIYLEEQLQDRLFRLLHYSLKPGGYLFLGSAEQLCGRFDLFDSVSDRFCIYRRLEIPDGGYVHFPARAQVRSRSVAVMPTWSADEQGPGAPAEVHATTGTASVDVELESVQTDLRRANDELRATNEELITVNRELKRRVVELGLARDRLLAADILDWVRTEEALRVQAVHGPDETCSS